MIHDPSAVSAKPKFLGDGLRPVLSREKPSVLGPDLGMSGLNFSADHGFFAIKTWENTGFSHPSFRENQHPNPPVESNFSMAGDGGNSHHRSLRHQQPPIKRSRLTLHCPLPKIKSFQNTVGKCWEPSGQVWMNQSMATLETLWKPQTTSCQQKSTTARSHCDAFLVSLLSV